MKIHHIAYMVADSHQASEAFSAFAPVRLVERQPLPAQGAFISMLASATDGTRIELVEPFESNVAMRRRLQMSGGDPTPYHICYSTTDFDVALRTALADGWLMVTKPFQGLDAGMRATHLYKRSAGMVEIIEDPAP